MCVCMVHMWYMSVSAYSMQCMLVEQSISVWCEVCDGLVWCITCLVQCSLTM